MSNIPAEDGNTWSATDLRHECEVFVDRMVSLSIGPSAFERAVDGVFDAMKFLLGKPR